MPVNERKGDFPLGEKGESGIMPEAGNPGESIFGGQSAAPNLSMEAQSEYRLVSSQVF
jgi:hypothetical protein